MLIRFNVMSLKKQDPDEDFEDEIDDIIDLQNLTRQEAINELKRVGRISENYQEGESLGRIKAEFFFRPFDTTLTVGITQMTPFLIEDNDISYKGITYCYNFSYYQVLESHEDMISLYNILNNKERYEILSKEPIMSVQEIIDRHEKGLIYLQNINHT